MAGSHNSIYQMSEKVYEALTVCASHEYYVFAILEPRDADTLDTRNDILKDLEEVKDLIRLGLLKDISKEYNKDIKKFQEAHGAGYKVIELTKEGIMLFANAKNRVIN